MTRLVGQLNELPISLVGRSLEAPVTVPMALLAPELTRDASPPALLPVLQESPQVRWKSRLLTTSLPVEVARALLPVMFSQVTTAWDRLVGTTIAFLQDL